MFEEQVFKWINETMELDTPDNVVAFCFNLGDTAGFQMELIGSEAFDKGDPDWPCEEVFTPEPRMPINIPSEFSGEGWENCLEKITALLNKYLQSNESGAQALASSQGIGVGFVDGDLTILKPLK